MIQIRYAVRIRRNCTTAVTSIRFIGFCVCVFVAFVVIVLALRQWRRICGGLERDDSFIVAEHNGIEYSLIIDEGH